MSRRITQDEVLDHLDEDRVDPDARALAHYQRVLHQARRRDPRGPDYDELPDLDGYGLRAGICALAAVLVIVALNALGLAIDDHTGMDVEVATQMAVFDLGSDQ